VIPQIAIDCNHDPAALIKTLCSKVQRSTPQVLSQENEPLEGGLIDPKDRKLNFPDLSDSVPPQ